MLVFDWLRFLYLFWFGRVFDGGFFSLFKYLDFMGAGFFFGVFWLVVDGFDLFFKLLLEFGLLILFFIFFFISYLSFFIGFLISFSFFIDFMDSFFLLMLFFRRSWRGLESRLLRFFDGGLLILFDNFVSFFCWFFEFFFFCRCFVISFLFWIFFLLLLLLFIEIFFCIVGLFLLSFLRDDFFWSLENSLDFGILFFNEY